MPDDNNVEHPWHGKGVTRKEWWRWWDSLTPDERAEYEQQIEKRNRVLDANAKLEARKDTEVTTPDGLRFYTPDGTLAYVLPKGWRKKEKELGEIKRSLKAKSRSNSNV